MVDIPQNQKNKKMKNKSVVVKGDRGLSMGQIELN